MDALARRLDAFMDGVVERANPETVQLMAKAAAALDASGVTRNALKVGDAAPDFTLPDQDNRMVSLAELRARGPVVLTFFRGGWCPFCALTLRALAEVEGELRRAGASLVAISPQTPDHAAATAERHFLSFPLLADAGNEVARRYRLAWTLGPDMQALYRKLGHLLPRINGTDDWTLPVPAGFVVRQDGIISYAHVDTRLTRRLEPRVALEVVRKLEPADAG